LPPMRGAVTTRFRETHDSFANPHRGVMTHLRAPGSKPPRLPASVTYIRVDWAELEPEEGRYNWKLFDDPIEAWKAQGVHL
jgi:hypothetical protein